jgi:hypothetical protein
VEADSPEQAEQIVVDLLRADPRLQEGVLNSREGPLCLFVEEIEEISEWPADTIRPVTGFAFYDNPDVSWRHAMNAPTSNHAMKGTAGSFGSSPFMKFHPQCAATRLPASRRSSYSR